MCLGGSNLLLSPSIYFFCAGFIIHVHSTEVQNNTNNDCNNHIVLLFFYHDNSQNIFMAHSCHQHAQSLTRAICRTDTRQKSILFIQAPNFNPISIGGVWDTAPLILWNCVFLIKSILILWLCFLTALQWQWVCVTHTHKTIALSWPDSVFYCFCAGIYTTQTIKPHVEAFI